MLAIIHAADNQGKAVQTNQISRTDMTVSQG